MAVYMNLIPSIGPCHTNLAKLGPYSSLEQIIKNPCCKYNCTECGADFSSHCIIKLHNCQKHSRVTSFSLKSNCANAAISLTFLLAVFGCTGSLECNLCCSWHYSFHPPCSLQATRTCLSGSILLCLNILEYLIKYTGLFFHLLLSILYPNTLNSGKMSAFFSEH